MMQTKQVVSIAILMLLAIPVIRFGVGLYRANEEDERRKVFGSPPDAEFCARWTSYYEASCKAFPAHCKEVPRKLARCIQGWDK